MFSSSESSSPFPQARQSVPDDTRVNTSLADYVWLPLRFVEPCAAYPQGMVFADWRNEWSPDEFEDE